jgi:hypothetical protein
LLQVAIVGLAPGIKRSSKVFTLKAAASGHSLTATEIGIRSSSASGDILLEAAAGLVTGEKADELMFGLLCSNAFHLILLETQKKTFA